MSEYTDDLANEIRRVDGAHSLGAGALAEALRPWLAEHDAALIESLADEWSEWETFTASDGHKSIRQHGLSPDEWLRARARQVREGEA